MSISNLGYFYFKEYYEDYFEKYYEEYKKLEDKEKEKKTKEHFENKDKSLFDHIELKSICKLESVGESPLFFKTTYPGLLVGSGLMHSIGAKGESKLGFEFDYTTGMPIINGSSVKGLIRSIFDLIDEKEEAIEYLRDIVLNNNEFDDNCKNKKLKIYKGKKLDLEYFRKLKSEIFEGIREEKNKLSIYERDIFYEAIIDIEKTKEENKSRNEVQILGEDYITPHKNPLENPIPIKFIKLMPNIVLRFQFDLKDGILKSKEKLALFEQILLDFGIGAKTNVGYGRLEAINN